jgi:hypothetical protein
MACKICGDPKTVKSHLLPRSFIKAIKGKHQTALVGFANALGHKHTQSGEFDPHLLCEEHERSLDSCDRYAFEWVTQYEQNSTLRRAHGGMIADVRNPKPDLLLKFVCSVLWRHALSDRMAGSGIDVGPWEPKLRDLIFNGGSYNPQFCIAKRDLLVNGIILKPSVIMVPHRKPVWGRRGWAFELAGFIWGVKLDDRSSGRMFPDLTANDRDPVPVWMFDPLPVTEREGLVDALARMGAQVKYPQS